VDHGGEGLGAVVAVAAFVDEADSGVDVFGERVGEVVVDGGEDAVEVVGDPAGEGNEVVDG